MSGPRRLRQRGGATVLGAALSLLVMRRPRKPAAPRGMGAYWLALVLLAGFTLGDDWLVSDGPRRFDPDGLPGIAFQALLALAAGGVLARLGAARPRLGWFAAGIALLLPAFSEFLLRPVERFALPELVAWPDEALALATDALWIAWVLGSFTVALRWLAGERRVMVRLLAALLATAISIVPRYYVPLGHLIVTEEPASDSSDEGQDDDGDEDEPEAEPEVVPAFDAQQVLQSQQRLLDEAIAQLAPQRPDQVDLYLVAFGGDGSENVFRNEVEYADRLFRERFDGEGRTLVLLNNPATVGRYPLATPGNLERALAAVGKVADPREDIVAVYLSSHGSADHELYVNLPPLSLEQVKPETLRAALDGCGVAHRVVLVSACYAGGFIPALQGPQTMVLAAARADRPSFGCGSDSEITYFGRALLVDGLNRATAFDQAFRIATREIAQWESARDEKHSHPQIRSTPAIEAQLARWQAGIRLGLPVRFTPADAPESPLR